MFDLSNLMPRTGHHKRCSQPVVATHTMRSLRGIGLNEWLPGNMEL